MQKRLAVSRTAPMPRHRLCSRWHAWLVLVWVLLLLAATYLSVHVVQQREATSINQAESKFTRAMQSYALSLERSLALVTDQMAAFATFMEQEQSADRFVRMFDAMNAGIPLLTWLQYVRHADRQRVEREIYDEMTAFYNTTEISRNFTSLVYDPAQASRVTGVRVSPSRPEYAVTRYVIPLEIGRATLQRDVLSEPSRYRLFNASRATRRVIMSPRGVLNEPNSRFSPTSTTVYVASVASYPVWSIADPSELRGVVAAVLTWTTLVQAGLEQDAPQPARVRLFDITGDIRDVFGCTFSLLFDGVRDGVTGAWTTKSVTEVLLEPCYASRAEIEALKCDLSVVREMSMANRKLLGIFENSGHLQAQVPVDTTLTALAVVLGSLVVVLLVGVMLRVWKLITALTYAQQDALDEAVHTAKAEFETRKALEQRDEFISLMSHELRSPLVSILASLDEAPTKAPVIKGAAEQMVATLNSVLSVQTVASSAVMDVDERPINLDTLFKSVCADRAVSAEAKDIELSYKWDERLPQIVYSDANVLSTIAHHLITNAVEFTEPGGFVTVLVQSECIGRSPDLALMRLSQFGSRSRIFASSRADDSDHSGVTVRLTVKDTGVGIDRRRMDKIFEPFIRERLAGGSRKHGQTELGLPTVRALVTRLGGIVDVTSTLGEGSDFVVLVFLPTRPSKPSRSTMTRSGLLDEDHDAWFDEPPTTPAQVRQALRGQRVLLAEDDDTSRFIIRTMLERELPYTEVVEAGSGEEAVDLVLHGDDERGFAAVYMDVAMPGSLDGTQASAAIRGEGVSTPIFGISGNPHELERLRVAGMTDLLLKPFLSRDLMQLLIVHWGDVSLDLRQKKKNNKQSTMV